MAKKVAVSIKVSRDVWTEIQIEAIRARVPKGDMVGEILSWWLLWLRRATREEAAEVRKEIALQEELVAKSLVRDAMTARRKRNRPKRIENLSRQAWHRRFPGKPWPGVNKQGTAANKQGST